MNIISLSGASGTGKSTAALSYAYTHHIDALIDDGLLIIDGKKRAGTSAKFEKSALKAVRRAIFSDDAHRDEVREAIDAAQLDSLMIIGTSDNMTTKIAERLGLPITQRIYIEDINSEAEIKLARFMRKNEGQHTMPLPMQQIEQNFFKRLMRRGVEIFSPKREKIGETTIVHPDFHDDFTQISTKDMMETFKVAIEESGRVTVKKMNFKLVPLPTLELQLVLRMKAQLGHTASPNAIEQAQQCVIETFSTVYDLQFDIITVKVVAVEFEE
ncbi:hypothetical protein [Kurthia huakuii]|uniref:hypothetical protein n=1 Tax=Kurthia huakuii TaxID=1421019 RepID=UPI00049578E7|nr:hypothetical protein [Kurthia huakuii]MBM7698153.1 hypothetical protein [Kurthia huakuii]